MVSCKTQGSATNCLYRNDLVNQGEPGGMGRVVAMGILLTPGNAHDENRLRLTCAGTRRYLEQQGIELREGMALTLYTDDANDEGRPDEMLAEGVVHYHEAEKCWVAAIDWNALRHASDGAAARGSP